MPHWTWALSVLSVVGVVANIYKRRWCFGVWLVTNTCWGIYDFTIGAHAQAALFAAYALLAAWGLIQWASKPGGLNDN